MSVQTIFPHSEIIVADSILGGFKLYPINYQVTMQQDSFPRVNIEGIMGDKFMSTGNKQELLRGFSMIDLMDEVGRRIKTGENKKESVKNK